MKLSPAVAALAVAFSTIAVQAQPITEPPTTARTIQYHEQDIVKIKGKLRYTTLIELPATEKIIAATAGDKDYWVVDVIGNLCSVHPAKAGGASNLNLMTDHGNIYSFTLSEVSASGDEPDLKVIVVPSDKSSIVAAEGPTQYVPAAQLQALEKQLASLQNHATTQVATAVDEYKSAYPTELKFDYEYKANEAPFNIQSIYHDDKFTYIKTDRDGEIQRVRDQRRQARPHRLRPPQWHLHHPEGCR